MATYVLLDTLPPQFFGISNGKAVPLSGGKLKSFQAGTSTPQDVYSDSSGTVLGTEVDLDSRGELMTVKNIWLKVGDSYKFRLEDSDGNEIWTVDDISTDQGIRTFSDQITINVPSAKAPFVLNALAQGQLVTGLNADQVDGAHVGTNNGNIVLKENLASAIAAATESAQGAAEIATQSEVDTGTDDSRFVTPKKLKSAVLDNLTKNQDSVLSQDGYQKIPGGLIMQWGRDNSGTINFPTAFSTSVFIVIGRASSDEDKIFIADNITVSSFRGRRWDTSSQDYQSGTVDWFALGV